MDQWAQKRKLQRKVRAAEGDEWQISFADMVTQLMCFFILMAAVGSVDVEQYKAVSESLGAALGNKTKAEQQTHNNFESMKEDLTKALGVDQSAASFEVRANAVAVVFKDNILFESGKADLNEASYSVLKKIVGPLQNTKYWITVEGHTDNMPIQSAQFPSNWELSSARASAVARFLIANGLPSDKMQVLGLADTRPLVPNVDARGQIVQDNQARNRRVVILIGYK